MRGGVGHTSRPRDRFPKRLTRAAEGFRTAVFVHDVEVYATAVEVMRTHLHLRERVGAAMTLLESLPDDVAEDVCRQRMTAPKPIEDSATFAEVAAAYHAGRRRVTR